MTNNKSSRKQYYVNYYRGFANTYNLYWASTPEQIAEAEGCGYERITRAAAIRLCVAENSRRRDNYSFSCYADNVIYPIDYDTYENEWKHDSRVCLNGYILEYKN